MRVFIGTQLRDGLVERPAGHSVWVSEGRGCPYLTLCMNVCIQHNREPPCLQPRDHAPFPGFLALLSGHSHAKLSWLLAFLLLSH